MNKKLHEVPMKEEQRIVSMGQDYNLAHRLMAMGIEEGSEMTVKQCALLGDPILVKTSDMNLSMRKADASSIEVKKASIS